MYSFYLLHNLPRESPAAALPRVLHTFMLEDFNINIIITPTRKNPEQSIPIRAARAPTLSSLLPRLIYYHILPITMSSTSWNSSWRESLYCTAPEAVHVVAILMMSESQPSSSIHCTEGYQGTASAGLRTHNNTDLDLMVAWRGFGWIFSCRWL